MTITATVNTRVCVQDSGVIEFRKDKVFLDDTDGSTSTATNINTYTPDMDPTTLPNRAQKIANIFWTPAIIAAWQAAHPAGGFS